MPLYNTIGTGYAAFRQPDPRIAAAIHAALGYVRSVANIGAGTGSYEPLDRSVVAVEPSEVMIRQRPARAARCVQGVAEALPLDTASVEAAMAILTTHHWTDIEQGCREMARIARQRVVILTWVPPPDSPSFWLTDEYFPEILSHDRAIFLSSQALTAMLERTIGPVLLSPVPVPHDCTDGFLCAYWRRPECYLDADRRSAISSFARTDAAAGLEKLRADLASGRWAKRYGALRTLESLDLGYRLACCEIDESKR